MCLNMCSVVQVVRERRNTGMREVRNFGAFMSILGWHKHVSLTALWSTLPTSKNLINVCIIPNIYSFTNWLEILTSTDRQCFSFPWLVRPLTPPMWALHYIHYIIYKSEFWNYFLESIIVGGLSALRCHPVAVCQKSDIFPGEIVVPLPQISGSTRKSTFLLVLAFVANIFNLTIFISALPCPQRNSGGPSKTNWNARDRGPFPSSQG